jgi:malate dehydrogenase (oxaloacetate-decarboxylating)(NADP+)
MAADLKTVKSHVQATCWALFRPPVSGFACLWHQTSAWLFAMSRPDETHRGLHLLRDPMANKGTAFTAQERQALGLEGLLPPRVLSQELQVKRVMENLAREETDLDRYIYLQALHDRNERLFYKVLIDHIQEMMPLIYTPTVGQACQEFGHIFRRPRGMFISIEDRGRIEGLLAHWPCDDVRVIVVTDGERILGLGDLGADGMGIPIGKLSLYTACAGIHPNKCLPITLDVGTDNEALLNDLLYIGLPRRRVRGEAYDAFIDEFVAAVASMFPKVVLQFEDFGNVNAFRLLAKYRDRLCTFNDDIQGTASVALAGLLSAMPLAGRSFEEGRWLFLGAGEAGLGIGHLIVAALAAEGMPEGEARKRCWYFDSKGLITADRLELSEHKRAFAHDHEPITDFRQAVHALKPTGILGASGVPGSFTRKIIEAVAEYQERPIVFSLSNPTSRSECTAQQVYEWTQGRAIFASGSPFAPVEVGGRTLVPGQGNNAYIFPGVGMGLLVSEASRVVDEMFLAAARTLADQVSAPDLESGRVYPPLSEIRRVSEEIAIEVAEVAYDRGLARRHRPADLRAAVKAELFSPEY